METFAHHDVGGVQVGTDFEANIESQTCDDAAVRTEIAENADQIFGTAVEKVQYEDYQCDLFQSSASFE